MDSESLKPTDIYKKHRGAVSVGCVTNGRRHSPLVDLAAIIAMQLALFTHHTIIPQSIVEWSLVFSSRSLAANLIVCTCT